MRRLLDGLGSLAGASAYLMVGLFATLETAALVGLFVPGELAMLAGGYIAYQGKAGLLPMMVVATICAILGDSLGYLLGRRLGPSLKRTRLGRRVGEERWARAEQYLVARGGRAVFFGRFVGVLRALVPTLSGASRMRYQRFLFWSALGGILWAPSVVGVGYLAGGSYRRVEQYSGRAGLVLLGLLVAVAGVAALGRWVANHPDEVRGFAQRVVDRPVVARFRRRYHGQLQFLAGRLRPGRALGLALTLHLVLLGAAGWAFGSIVQDVLAHQGATQLDLPITRTLLDHQVHWLTDALEAIGALGSAAPLLVAVLLGGIVAWRVTGNWVPLLILALCLGGSAVLGDVVKPLIGRARPGFGLLTGEGGGYAFPSGHATSSVAVYGCVAYIAAGWLRTWGAKVAAWTAAFVLVLLIGFSRVYLGEHWATDVLGGYALGALWLAAVLVTTSAIRGARYRGVGQEPSEEEPVPTDAAVGSRPEADAAR